MKRLLFLFIFLIYFQSIYSETLILEVNQTSSDTMFFSVCESELPFQWNSITLTSGGTYSDTLINVHGNDSIITITLQVFHSYHDTTEVNICEVSLPYIWNTYTIKSSGVYSDTLLSLSGCDSIVTIIVTENLTDCQFCQNTVPYRVVILDNVLDSIWILNEHYLIRQGSCCTNIDTTENQGCISFNVYLDEDAIGLIFDVNDPTPSEVEYYRVDCGDPIPLGEFICLAGGRFHTLTFCMTGEDKSAYSIQSIGGLMTTDSIIIDNESENSIELNISGVEPSTIEWSVKYPNNSDYLLDYLDISDKENPVLSIDSLIHSLIIFEVCGTVSNINCGGTPIVDCSDIVIKNSQNTITTLQYIEMCEGNIVEWNGTSLANSGFYSDTLVSSYGYDSISILEVNVIPNIYDTINIELERGSSPYPWTIHYIETDNDSCYITNFISKSGCDSTIRYNVTIKTSTSNQLVNIDESLLNVFPNPCVGIFTIEMNSIKNNLITLEIFDNSGRMITKKDFPVANGRLSKKINLSDEKYGMYHLKILDGENSFSKSIIIGGN